MQPSESPKLELPPNEVGFLVIDNEKFIKPEDQNFILNDLSDHEISNALQFDNLTKAEFPASYSPQGIIWGPNNRLVVSLTCQRQSDEKVPTLNVVFIINTLSPYTYLSNEAVQALIGDENVKVPNSLVVKIHSEHPVVTTLSPSNSDFSTMNVLGMDFFTSNKLFPDPDFDKRTFQLKWGPRKTIIQFGLKPFLWLGIAAASVAVLVS